MAQNLMRKLVDLDSLARTVVRALIVLLLALAQPALADDLPREPRGSSPANVSEGADSPSAARSALPATVAVELSAETSANNAWMMAAAGFVLLMIAPGLTLFYSGLVRKKNVLAVMMQCIFLMGLMTILWGLYGYSLSFGGSRADPQRTSFNPYLGNSQYLLMSNVQRRWDDSVGAPVTPLYRRPGAEHAVPRLTHMVFQGMFFIITPALMCGAFAERMRFKTMVVFMILWSTLVFCPLCHWVWGEGLLSYGDGLGGGALDFAGGTVVHVSSGVAALMCALVMGRRLGYGSEPMPPHNLTYTVIGAMLMWAGWFGFNAGSQFASDGVSASAVVATQFAAAAGLLAWAGLEWHARRRPSVLGACSGAVAGLVAVTPAAGYIEPIPAMLVGALSGVACYYACIHLKKALRYDDSLDAFGIHGVAGTLGAMLTGVFATRHVAAPEVSRGLPLGVVDGNLQLLVGQAIAVGLTWIYSALVTYVLLKVLDNTLGLRVGRDVEIQGLDVSEHGEEGYIFL